MEITDVLIVGAGAAGLNAARLLSESGKNVIVLEARDRTGGRIYTCTDEDFVQPVDLGAEFIHGKLPLTISLLKEANISYSSIAGEMWRFQDGKLQQTEEFLPDFDLLIRTMNEIKTDCSLDEFLQTHFSDPKHAELGRMLRSFAAGYDTAEPAKFSMFAMRRELNNDDNGHQYRIDGGYIKLIDFLEEQFKAKGGSILLSKEVKYVRWQEGNVKVTTTDGEEFDARKIILTAPLNVLTNKDSMKFKPAIPEQMAALEKMGMGAVIKVIIQFDTIFWEEQAARLRLNSGLKNLGFLFSNERIPTWWTLRPHHTSVLTGWLGGPEADKLKDAFDETILQIALQSLSKIFDITTEELRKKIIVHKILNWTAAPFTLGSYSYATVETPAARELLLQGVANTIYFAGEAMYEGPEMGTVEAALASAVNVVKKIL